MVCDWEKIVRREDGVVKKKKKIKEIGKDFS